MDFREADYIEDITRRREDMNFILRTSAASE